MQARAALVLFIPGSSPAWSLGCSTDPHALCVLTDDVVDKQREERSSNCGGGEISGHVSDGSWTQGFC